MRKTIYLILIVVIAVVLFLNREPGRNPDQTNTDPSTNPENITLDTMKDNPNTQLADLTAVDGSDSVGTGFRFVQDGTLLHSVTATMPDPAEGNNYEGWLVQTSPLKLFSTGLLTKAEDGTWMLEYTSEEESPNFLKVVITEETVIDDTPEVHILEGNF